MLIAPALEAYKAVRVFTAYAQDPKYQLIFRYEPGDLLSFDNRRILHGRRGYAASKGVRYIECVFMQIATSCIQE